jgi:agmatine/peptidylarginine deiminase
MRRTTRSNAPLAVLVSLLAAGCGAPTARDGAPGAHSDAAAPTASAERGDADTEPEDLGPLAPGSPFSLRIAAEWEPAVGVLVAWPLTVPHRLVVDLAADTTLHTLVADETARAQASDWYGRWGIDLSRVAWIVAPQGDDVSWVRDWGPHALFDETGAPWLVDANYSLATPITGYGCDEPLATPWNGGWGEPLPDYDVAPDDAAPALVAATLGLGHLPVPYALTGGNFATDGHGLALSSCILVNENRTHGFEQTEFLALARTQLGQSRYAILSNFEERGIQHVDCMLKLLDERRILVARPPQDHPSHAVYERIVREELAELRTFTGGRFEILPLDTARHRDDELAAYTNALILNRNVYVPLFGIPQDEIALAQWRAALPGHRVRGYTFVLADEPALAPSAASYDTIGWTGYDALHCRTRAVWDPRMLAVDLLSTDVLADGRVQVRASIVDHSGRGVRLDATYVAWRDARRTTWNQVPLVREADGRFAALLPAPPEGSATYYTIHAASAASRTASAPTGAPEHFFVHVRPATQDT